MFDLYFTPGHAVVKKRIATKENDDNNFIDTNIARLEKGARLILQF